MDHSSATMFIFLESQAPSDMNRYYTEQLCPMECNSTAKLMLHGHVCESGNMLQHVTMSLVHFFNQHNHVCVVSWRHKFNSLSHFSYSFWPRSWTQTLQSLGRPASMYQKIMDQLKTCTLSQTRPRFVVFFLVSKWFLSTVEPLVTSKCLTCKWGWQCQTNCFTVSLNCCFNVFGRNG